MNNFIVMGDPKNDQNKNCSSYIITSHLNQAAEKIGLDINAGDRKVIVYDGLGSAHGYSPDAHFIPYETIFPDYILNNCQGRHIIGCSKENIMFAVQAGYPKEKCHWFNLGVDSQKWRYCYLEKPQKKFRFLSLSESNSRGGLDQLVKSFCETFSGNNGVELYIRDRSAEPKFKEWIRENALLNNVNIILDDRDLFSKSDEIDVYSTANCAISLNHSSTWDMRFTECMSCGIPVIGMCYSGHREYLIEGQTGFELPFKRLMVPNEQFTYYESIGIRNYIPYYMHSNKPVYWAQPDLIHLSNLMKDVVENSRILSSISYKTRYMAETLTWERSAQLLSNLPI